MIFRFFVISCALLLAANLPAQVETSTAIRGLITDPTGAAVPGARVAIRNVATGEERSAVADNSGAYSFPSVVPGTYDIVVTHPGLQAGRGDQPRGAGFSNGAGGCLAADR
jgi:hypothetical protein